MIEIAEIDHALRLACDRAECRLWAEVHGILEMLRDEIGSCGPELTRAIYIAETSGREREVGWAEIREECLLAVNAEIIRVLRRTELEAKGLAAINRARQEERDDRRELVRREYRPGDSAEAVRRKIVKYHGENFRARTLSRDLKEMFGR